MNESFFLSDLAERLGIPINAMRIAVASGTILCSRRDLADPPISREAAVEFCIRVGICPARLVR
jgi:hypothetical protein